MTVHFSPETVKAVPVKQRERGKRAYLTGAAAEDRVVQTYEARGARALQLRWRGGGAEIDLIVQEGAVVVFVEVKSGPTHDAAIARLQPAQMKRIYRAAEAYLAYQPLGQLTEVRFDVALYDYAGTVQIVENAFGHF